MNLSGMSVRELVAKHEIRPETDLIVIYDELDLPLGTIRIRQRGSSAGHNGMKSIIGALGTQEFLRIRLGIAPERKIADGVKFVLTPFRKAQLKTVDEVLENAAEAVKGDFEGRSGGGDEPLQPESRSRQRARITRIADRLIALIDALI